MLDNPVSSQIDLDDEEHRDVTILQAIYRLYLNQRPYKKSVYVVEIDKRALSPAMLSKVNNLLEDQETSVGISDVMSIVMDTLLSMIDFKTNEVDLPHQYFQRIIEYDENCGSLRTSVQLPGKTK